MSPGPLHLGPQRAAGGEACAGKWGCVCKPRGVRCGGTGPTLCRFQSAQVCVAAALPTFDCHFRPVISDGPHLGRLQLGSSPTRRPHLKPSERSVMFPLCRDLCLSEQSWSAGGLAVDFPRGRQLGRELVRRPPYRGVTGAEMSGWILAFWTVTRHLRT